MQDPEEQQQLPGLHTAFDGGLQPVPEYDDIFAVFTEAARLHRQERDR
jgi:hypothetical protein